MHVPAASDKAERFDKQIRIYFNDLYRSALRLTGHASDAEDLVQETCLRAFKAFDQLRQPDAAPVWVFAILRSVYLREEERRPSRTIVSLDDIAASFLTPHEMRQDTYRRFVPPEQPRREEIREAMLKLPLVYREAVVLAHVAGFSYREMAEILACPVGTVMSRLFRGRRMRRTFLGDSLNPADTA